MVGRPESTIYTNPWFAFSTFKRKKESWKYRFQHEHEFWNNFQHSVRGLLFFGSRGIFWPVLRLRQAKTGHQVCENTQKC